MASTRYSTSGLFIESGYASTRLDAARLNSGGTGTLTQGPFASGNTPLGSPTTVSLPPITVTFANVTQAGATSLATSATGPPAPTGYFIAAGANYYTLTTTALFTTAVVCITDPSITATSVLLHYNPPPGGMNVTAPNYPTGTTICSIPLTSLSPFVIAAPATFTEQPITATPTKVSAVEGEVPPFSGTVATFTDPDTSSTATDYSASIVWGDGASSSGTISGGSGSFSVSGTHTYAEEGSHTVIVTISDIDSSNSAVAGSTATVADAPLIGQRACPATIQPNFTGATATFTDAKPGPHLEDFTAVINWGDGSSSTGVISGSNPYTVSGTHDYTTGGPHTITTTITDVGGSTLSLSCDKTIVSCDQQGDNQGQIRCNDPGECDLKRQPETRGQANAMGSASDRAKAMEQDRQEDANDGSDAGNTSCKPDGQDQGASSTNERD